MSQPTPDPSAILAQLDQHMAARQHHVRALIVGVQALPASMDDLTAVRATAQVLTDSQMRRGDVIDVLAVLLVQVARGRR